MYWFSTQHTRNTLSITLSLIDPGIPSSRKGWKFSPFPKRDGEWHKAGCIGTSLSGSWRSSCGSCLAGRLFPGVQREVRTGKESSASNITPPATEAERPNIRFISKLGASNSTGVGIIANREDGRGASSMVHPILRSVCNFAPPVGRSNKRGDRETNFRINRPPGIHSIYFASLSLPLSRNFGIPTDETRVFEMSLIFFSPRWSLIYWSCYYMDRS